MDGRELYRDLDLTPARFINGGPRTRNQPISTRYSKSRDSDRNRAPATSLAWRMLSSCPTNGNGSVIPCLICTAPLCKLRRLHFRHVDFSRIVAAGMSKARRDAPERAACERASVHAA